MGQIEKSKFWLDIEFQYWGVGYDKIIKFTIGETGNIRLESVENLDPDDTLSNLEVSTLSKYFPRTANQFLDAILELEPKIFQVSDLCTSTYKGDQEILEKIWEYLDVTNIDREPIPDEEVEFVRSSRPHLPGKSPKEIRDFKSLHGLDFRRVLIVGDQEYGIANFGYENYALELRELFLMDNSQVSNPNFTFALKLPSFSELNYVFKVMNFRREYSIGYLEYNGTQKWVKIPGTPGHSLAIFILSYLKPFVKAQNGNTIVSLDQILSFLVDFPDSFGNHISMETTALNLHFKLDESPNDYGTFLSRFELEPDTLDMLDALTNYVYQGRIERRLGEHDSEEQFFEISISRVSSNLQSQSDWQIAYAAGFESVSRIFSGENHLVDILLKIFKDCALYLQIENSNQMLSFPPAKYLPLDGKYALLTFYPENF